MGVTIKDSRDFVTLSELVSHLNKKYAERGLSFNICKKETGVMMKTPKFKKPMFFFKEYLSTKDAFLYYNYRILASNTYKEFYEKICSHIYTYKQKYEYIKAESPFLKNYKINT